MEKGGEKKVSSAELANKSIVEPATMKKEGEATSVNNLLLS